MFFELKNSDTNPEWKPGGVGMGRINAGRVRIYKFNSFKTFTDRESGIYNDKTKNSSALSEAIRKNTEARRIDCKYLKEEYEVAVFENDVIRLALQDRGIEKADDQLLDEIVYLEVYHNEILRQILNQGVYVGGREYLLFAATAGQVRNTTVTLMRKDFYEIHKGCLMAGLSLERMNTHRNQYKKEIGMNVGKYLSYRALPLSSSVCPEHKIDLERCMVVKGMETVIADRVKFVDIRKDRNGQCYVADTPKGSAVKKIRIEHTDGAGMFLPGELPLSCQIRGGYFKGAMFPFDFRMFIDQVAQNSVIPDAWGNMVDVKKADIRFIFTASQLKMWKEYDSWEEYKKEFRAHGLSLTINSYGNPVKEAVPLAYQYLQTLPYNTDISGLCRGAMEDLNSLKTDFEYVKRELGLTNDAVTDEDHREALGDLESNGGNGSRKRGNSYLAKALDLYPALIYDPYVKRKIQSLFNARKKGYMGGKLPVRGYYCYIAPDLYAFCEYLFLGEKDPQGLIPKNYVYNRYYDEYREIENVICLRSPHLSGYEYAKRKLMHSDQCRKWFGAMESDTVVSCHDLISKSLQCDWDGDEILISPDENLYRAAEPLPEEPLYYEMQKANARIIDQKAIYDTLVKGFDNNVIGEASNAITKLWNSPKRKTNPLEYDDAVNVFCAYSNYAIDFPKTGKNLALGEYEQLYRDLIPPEDIRERMKPPKVKYPQFFKYAKGRKNNLEGYTDSPMDRIAKYIETRTGRKRYLYFDGGKQELPKFDYRMLMNNERKPGTEAAPLYEVKRSDRRYELLYNVLNSRKKRKKAICREIQKERRMHNRDTNEITAEFDVFHYHCVREIKEIFTDTKGFFNVNLAVNAMIDMEYNQPAFTSTSKDILWKCFGHVIIDNMNRNLKTGIIVKERPRMAYRKGVAGDARLDRAISKRLERKGVIISQGDLDFMEAVLKTKKNGNYYSYDKELLFVLLCHYKYAERTDGLEKGYLQIMKRKHMAVKKSGQKTKVPIRWNMNTFMNMAGAKSYTNSLKRFGETGLIRIEEDTAIRIKMDLSHTNQGAEAFMVEDLNHPYVYLLAYEQGKPLAECVICGKHFLKGANNQKTCSKSCSERLQKFNVGKNNERRRAAVFLDAKKQFNIFE